MPVHCPAPPASGTIPGQAEHRSGIGPKVFGFASKSCSPSARNAVRRRPGILFAINPEQRSASSGFRSYRELRSKPLLTAVGEATVLRPYYLCAQCHRGQFPADVELDIEHTEFSPGVRRMQGVVGPAAPFDHGRRQLKLLADLEVTTKAVERTAEAIGEDIAVRQQTEIQRAMQLISLL